MDISLDLRLAPIARSGHSKANSSVLPALGRPGRLNISTAMCGSRRRALIFIIMMCVIEVRSVGSNSVIHHCYRGGGDRWQRGIRNVGKEESLIVLSEVTLLEQKVDSGVLGAAHVYHRAALLSQAQMLETRQGLACLL